MIKLEYLTDKEYEALYNTAIEDSNLQDAFLDANAQEWEEWGYERGIHHDYIMDYGMDYIESREENYLEFALKYYRDLPNKDMKEGAV